MEDDSLNQKYDYFRFYETIYRKLGPELYLGAGLLYNLHTDVRPLDDEAAAAWPDSPYVQYSEKHGLDPARQASAGFSVQALLDNRDGPINPGRGWYAEATWMQFYEGFLGGTSDWSQLSYDVWTYVRLSKDARHRPWRATEATRWLGVQGSRPQAQGLAKNRCHRRFRVLSPETAYTSMYGIGGTMPASRA